MTRAQARRKKRRKAKMQRALGWTLIFTFGFTEICLQCRSVRFFVRIFTRSARAIPMANASRYYPGIGGEWIAIMLVFCLVFKAVHERICDWIFEEE